jgi:hypothetical protein
MWMMRIRSKSMALRWMGRAAPVWIMWMACACGTMQSQSVASGAPASGASSGANGSATASPAEEPTPAGALATVARYTGGKQVKAEELIRKLGYVPPMGESAWNGLAVVRQLEVAFRAAAAADPDRGGQFFLAAFLRDLTPSSEAAKKDASLLRLVKLATLLGEFRFKEPSAAQTSAPLPKDIVETIRLLAEYSSRSLLGSQHHILVKYFKLPSDAAFELFAGGQSYHQVLLQALGKVEAGQQDGVLRSIVASLATHYDTARRERSLAPFLGNGSPPAEDAPPEPAPAPAATDSSASAGILRVENPGTVAFDLYLNRKLLGRIGTGVTASFSVAPGIHGFEWRETEANSPFSDPQPLNVTAGHVHTLKAPRILTCTRSCANGTCGPWECPPGLSPPSG